MNMKTIEISKIPKNIEIIGAGKTTGAILKAIGTAMINPGEIIIFSDHNQLNTWKWRKHLAEAVGDLIKKLRLNDIEVKVDNKNVTILSNYYGCYYDHDKKVLLKIIKDKRKKIL